MRQKGTIVDWKDDKGFGFIKPLNQSKNRKDVFVHISDIKSLSRSPKVKDIITFTLVKDDRGRSRAVEAVIISAQKKPIKNTIKEYNLLVALAFISFVIACFFAGRVHHFIVLGYLLLSIACFGIYALDKKSSKRKGASRIPEKILLFVGLLGGWPGAILAQQILRHKSSKKSFLRLFWITVLVNVAGFILYLNY